MKTKEYICVLCPNSCTVTVVFGSEGIEEISGHGCERGREWAENEVVRPRRYFVGSVTVRNGDYETVSVKTSDFIPLEKAKAIGLHTHTLCVEAPVKMYQVIERDLLGLKGVDLIATREVHRKNGA
ncbi:MAG: DUF1667 domain-containing protein, partial [Sediminispirochaetaceae bacterium]